MAASVAFRARVPYLLEPCGMMRPRVRSIAVKRAFDATIGRPIIDRAATVIATSGLERSEMIEDGVPPGRIRTRRTASPFRRRPRVPTGRSVLDSAIPRDAPLVLALGRITRKKGLPDLVEAVSRLSAVYLLIAGPDSNDGTLSALRRRSSTMNGRLRVDVRGLWEREKFEAFAEADCFALPSQTENFGNAAAEAAAVGLPVVVSDACGVAEVLDPSAHRVIGVGDVDALTAAIVDLIRGRRAKACRRIGRSRSSGAPGLVLAGRGPARDLPGGPLRRGEDWHADHVGASHGDWSQPSRVAHTVVTQKLIHRGRLQVRGVACSPQCLSIALGYRVVRTWAESCDFR